MTFSQIHVADDSMGFVRLITNTSMSGVGSIRTTDNEALLRMRAYAFAAVKGNGKSPYCPVVQMVEAANAYRVRDFPKHPEQIDFPSVLDVLEEKYHELSPGSTVAGEGIDLTTVVASFSHRDAMADTFCDALSTMHIAYRHRFIRQGLMIAYMHPTHPLGSSSKKKKPGTEPLYLSGIPLVVVRRMIPADDRFMRESWELEAYEGFFGKRREPTGWHMD